MPDRIVAIDCDVAGATVWTLSIQDVNEAMRDELRARAEKLAHDVRDE